LKNYVVLDNYRFLKLSVYDLYRVQVVPRAVLKRRERVKNHQERAGALDNVLLKTELCYDATAYDYEYLCTAQLKQGFMFL
jgi:hypothetical protein